VTSSKKLRKVMRRKPEEESLEVTLLNRHRRCGRDMLEQTERAAATGKAQLPTVDSRVRRTFSDSEEANRRCLLARNRPCTRAHRRDMMHLPTVSVAEVN